VRAALLQIDVLPDETVETRRDRVAAAVGAQGAADLVVLPELWTTGAFAYDAWAAAAEPLTGPTAAAMAAAAREAGVWLHAGSIVERAGDEDAPVLYNTSLVFDPAGELRATYRKIHRFGFGQGEAVAMDRGREIVTTATPWGTLGLATCYDLRFPEQFRLLVDAGAEVLVIPAGWPARRREHWRLLVRARAVESQAYVLACCEAGTHADVEQAGHSLVVDPWGEILAEAGPGEETLTAELDPSQVAGIRTSFPVLQDRVLGLPEPGTRG
jgi:predicted amidohydrolase